MKPLHLHPLDLSVKCRHCGKGDLVFLRSRAGRDLYRCLAEIPCKPYTAHWRRYGRVCGISAEVGTGLVVNWIECADCGPAKGE